MADVSGQVTQSAAPGSLLRTVAEAQTQDPSKVQASSQVGSPIRDLVQNPIESNIPSTSPRVLNETPLQTPSADFSGLHDMLSAAPVPPPHVAAQLIRAMMTPPGQGNVVSPVRPSVPAPSNPAMGNNPVAPQRPAPTSPGNSGSIQAVRPGNTSSVISSPLRSPSLNLPSAISSGGLNFSPTAQQSQSAPQLRQNVLGGRPFIGGTVGEGLASLGGLGGLFSKLGGLFSRGLGAAEGEAPNVESLIESLPL